MLHKKYKKIRRRPPGGRACPGSRMVHRQCINTRVRRAFSDLYNDKNVQTAHRAPERRIGRGNDQTTIYIPGGIIHACTAFWRVG